MTLEHKYEKIMCSTCFQTYKINGVNFVQNIMVSNLLLKSHSTLTVDTQQMICSYKHL